jgi:hypothetical protein
MTIAQRAAACAACVLCACGQDAANPGEVAVRTVTVTLPLAANLVPGESTIMGLIVTDDAGRTLSTPPAVTWSISDTSTATISQMGELRALAAGNVTVTAISGGVSGSRAVTIDQGGLAGPAGATITAFGGGVVLVVPAGAVSASTVIRIGPITAPPPDPSFVRGSAAALAFAGTFSVPARLSLGYDPALGPGGLPESALSLRMIANGAWTSIAGGSVNTTTHIATGPITRAGDYGVGRAPSSSPCTAAQYREMDFRLGRFNWAGPAGFTGEADIIAEASGCAVAEVLRLSNGAESRALYFYEPVAQRWHYTTITGTAVSRYSGGLDGTRGVFTNAARSARFIWERSGNAHTHASESSADGGNTWVRQAAGTYTPK